MIAHFQKILALLWLVASAGWFWAAAGRLHPAFLLLGAVSIMFAHSLVLAIEFMLVHRMHRNHPVYPTRLSGLARAWLVEACLALRVFLWEQAFRSQSIPDCLQGAPGRRPVVLVHGYLCNRGFWNPWMRRLRAAGIPYCAVTLEPPFGSIDAAVDSIEIAVQRARHATGHAPLIVAHSMGGLSVRAWMRGHADESRVHHVVTIASPNQGTRLADLSTSRNARQMRMGSAWLAELSRSEDPARYRRFTCFYGHCDNVVFPMESAMLPGADNRHVEEAAHIQMARREAVFSAVIRLLQQPALPT